MVYRYDYDVKNELIDLLETKQDFSGVLEMPYYLEQYHQETSTARQNLQRFLIYKLSYYLDDSDLKQFDCDVCEEMTTSYLKTYHWLDGYRSEQQPSTAVKYEVTNGNITYRGDTMTSICKNKYGSIQRLDEICRLNGIAPDDIIYAGQKLMLPE